MESGQRASRRESYRIADLTLDAGARLVHRGPETLPLPPLSFDLLLELARAYPDALTIDELVARVWRGRVVSQATVAKRVELLRQALGDDSAAPRYVMLVRGHGYRLVDARPPPAPRHPLRSWRVPLAAAGLLAAISLAVGLLVGGNREAAKPLPENSIAVLPFTAMTKDSDDELLADGLAEEISHRLANVRGLKVAGRTSSFYFKGRSEDVRTIGRTLGVAYVLEGVVRRDQGRLRVTAQLIDARDGFHRWSRAYERPAGDLLAIQQDIAEAVARRLELSLPGGPAGRSEATAQLSHPGHYERYLKALQLSASGQSRRVGRAQALLEDLVEREPGFAPAWILLAEVYLARWTGDHPGYGVGPAEAWQAVDGAIEQARALAPPSPRVQVLLGRVDWLRRGDGVAAAAHFRQAHDSGGSDLDVLAAVARFAREVGQLRTAAALEARIVRRDPLCAVCYFHLAKTRRYQRQYADAETALRRFTLLQGGGAERTLGLIQLLDGRPRAALEQFRRLDHHLHLRRQGVAMAWHALGRGAASDRALGELIELDGADHPLTVAAAHAYRGEIDAAFAWLEKLGREGAQKLRTDFQEPLFDALRNDPRWRAILARHGVSGDALAAVDLQLSAPAAAAGS